MLYYHGYGMGTKLVDLERLLKSDGGGAWRSTWAKVQKQRTNSILTTGNLLNRPTVLHAQIKGVVRIFIQPQFTHCPSSFSYSSIITVYFVYCNIINHHKIDATYHALKLQCSYIHSSTFSPLVLWGHIIIFPCAKCAIHCHGNDCPPASNTCQCKLTICTDSTLLIYSLID